MTTFAAVARGRRSAGPGSPGTPKTLNRRSRAGALTGAVALLGGSFVTATVALTVATAPPAAAINTYTDTSATPVCTGFTTFTAPNGTVSVTISITGGGGGGGESGGGGTGGTGGSAGTVSGTFTAAAGNVLRVRLGCGGAAGGPNSSIPAGGQGYSSGGNGNGGGGNSNQGGAGGGSSVACLGGDATCTAGSSPTVLAIAAGGGAGGGHERCTIFASDANGGNGGTGGSGAVNNAGLGQVRNGAGGGGTSNDGQGGGAGTNTGVGGGGAGSNGGSSGSGGTGGQGGNNSGSPEDVGGGGGGAGYFGGGGGGGDFCVTGAGSGGGGGGGSSYVNTSIGSSTSFGTVSGLADNCGHSNAQCTSFSAGNAGKGGNIERTGAMGTATIQWNVQQVSMTVSPASLSGNAGSTANIGAYTVTLRDYLGNAVTPPSAVTINLSSNSTGTKGFSTTSGGSLAGTSITIGTGASSGTFYYGDSLPGSKTLTIAASGLTSVTTTAVVNPSPTTTGVSCTNPFPYNGSSICTVTVTDTSVSPVTKVTPTGTITLAATGGAGSGAFTACTLAQTVLGTSSCQSTLTATLQDSYTVTATFPTNLSHSTSNGNTSVKMGARATTTAVSCAPASVAAGSPTTCTALVTDVDAGTVVSPTGTITFGQSGGGSFTSTTCALVFLSASQARCTTDFTPTYGGNKTVTASYAGATSGSASGGFRHRSSAATPFPVSVTGATGRHPTTTSVSCVPSSVPLNTGTTCTATVTDTFTLGPTSTPTGTVTFGYSGGGAFSPSNTCTLAVLVANVSSSCSRTFTPSGAVGNKTVNAFYGGTTTHFTSGSGSVLVVATAGPPPPSGPARHDTTTSVNCSSSSTPVGVGVTCTATVTDVNPNPYPTNTPTGSVTFGYSGGGAFSPSNTCTLVQLVVNVSASCTVTFTPSGPPGNKTVNAFYNGTTLHKTSGSGSFFIAAT